MSCILNWEFEDSQTLGSSKLSVEISWWGILQIRSNVRLKHRKIKLHIFSCEWDPLTTFLLIDRQKVLNAIFNKVVFWIDSISVYCAFLLMFDAINTQDARFLHYPVNHLFTEAAIVAFVPCKVLVAAHGHRACEDSPVVVEWLVAADEGQLFSDVFADAFAPNLTWLSWNFTVHNREDIWVRFVKSLPNTLEFKLWILCENWFIQARQRLENVFGANDGALCLVVRWFRIG